MSLVERYFRVLTVDCVRDGSFGSVKELASAIEAQRKSHRRHRNRNSRAQHVNRVFL
jgi:hypothetical protein